MLNKYMWEYRKKNKNWDILLILSPLANVSDYKDFFVLIKKRGVKIKVTDFYYIKRKQTIYNYQITKGGNNKILIDQKVNNINVISFCFSSKIALSICQQHPEKIKSIILIDPALPQFFSSYFKNIYRLLPIVIIPVWLIQQSYKLLFNRPYVYVDFSKDKSKNNLYNIYQILRQNSAFEIYKILMHFKKQLKIAKIDVPMLVLTSKYDRLIDQSKLHQYFSQFPNCKIKVFPFDHFQSKAKTIAYTDEIIRFLG